MALLLRARRAKLIIAYAGKKKPCHFVCLYVCVYVTLHSSGVLRQISDFLVLKITKKICGATRKKNKFIYLISSPVINEKLLK
jgi:hypothetical protein